MSGYRNPPTDIDWRNTESVWFAEPSNHRLVPGGTEYEDRYFFVRDQVTPGSRVLDVGCNCGQLAENLTRDLDCKVVGVDIVGQFIAHCQEDKAKYGTFYQADFSRMDPDLFDQAGLWGTFDAVTALEVIEHPIDVRGFRDNAIKALKPGGRLIITTPHPISGRYGYRYMNSHAHHVRMWSRLRLEMVFGPCLVFQGVCGPPDEPGHIAAVFAFGEAT